MIKPYRPYASLDFSAWLMSLATVELGSEDAQHGRRRMVISPCVPLFTEPTGRSHAALSLMISHRRILLHVVALITAVLMELCEDRDPALLRSQVCEPNKRCVYIDLD